MKTDLQGIDVHGTEHGVRGAWVRGEAPQELVLTDGTRLRLEPADAGRARWRHADEVAGEVALISAGEAAELAGDHSGYVRIRTRAEAEWLRAVSDWCRAEAGRLESELAV